MSQLQREVGSGPTNDTETKANMSDLAGAADRARQALEAADADLQAKKDALRAAIKGPPKHVPKTSVGRDRSRSYFDNPGGDFCSC